MTISFGAEVVDPSCLVVQVKEARQGSMVFTVEQEVATAEILVLVPIRIPEPVKYSKYLATFLRLLYSRRGQGSTLISLGEQATLTTTSLLVQSHLVRNRLGQGTALVDLQETALVGLQVRGFHVTQGLAVVMGVRSHCRRQV